ncbi:MAG: hypothetical protein CO133_01930, partial [Candidatus Komeilibacteria bacterium CG_4_9_14_3_um_filter_37_5]
KDLSRSDHKKNIAADLLPLIAKLPDQIERSHYLQKLANLLNVSEKILTDKLKLPTTKDSLASKTEKEQEINLDSSLDIIKHKIAEGIIAILLLYPDKIRLVITELLPEELPELELADIYKTIVMYYNSIDSSQINNNLLGRSNLHDFLEKQRPDWLNRITTLELLATKEFSDLQPAEIDYELEQRIQRLKKEIRLIKVANLTSVLKQAEASGDQELIDQLLTQIHQCHQELKNLS